MLWKFILYYIFLAAPIQLRSQINNIIINPRDFVAKQNAQPSQGKRIAKVKKFQKYFFNINNNYTYNIDQQVNTFQQKLQAKLQQEKPTIVTLDDDDDVMNDTVTTEPNAGDVARNENDARCEKILDQVHITKDYSVLAHEPYQITTTELTDAAFYAEQTNIGTYYGNKIRAMQKNLSEYKKSVAERQQEELLKKENYCKRLMLISKQLQQKLINFEKIHH